MRFLILYFLLPLSCLLTDNAALLAQSPNKGLPEPEVGKPCPNFFFTKIDFYKSKKLYLSDLKGKWVVLDFWSIGCSGCVASLPKISKEQIALNDKVQFIMVGPEARPEDRKMYANYQGKLKLAMPSAFDDDLFKSFNVGLLPHVIIIDPDGIVKAITTNADSSKLRALLSGGNPKFAAPTYADNKSKSRDFKYSDELPYLVEGNGGNDSDFIFRSLLTHWRPGNPRHSERLVNSLNPIMQQGRFEFLRGSLSDLYAVAYLGMSDISRTDSNEYGKLYPIPIFEIDDPDILKPDKVTGHNQYCYSLKVPREKAHSSFMMQVMQNDLKNYFGYEVSIETRKMPYWRLIASEKAKAKLKTKGGAEVISSNGKPWQENLLKNQPMSILLTVIDYYSEVTINGSPLLDETGINYNIDIDLDWVKGDYQIIRKALQKNGLDLLPGEKDMRCLIVRETRTNKK